MTTDAVPADKAVAELVGVLDLVQIDKDLFHGATTRKSVV